jgi:hypothetical protein
MTSSFYRPPIKDITITSSIGRKSSSLYYGQTTPQPPSDFESFPIEAISSSTAGVFPDLHGSVSSSNYYINITQSWSSSILGPLGYGVFVNDDQKEFYNGELSGSNLTISDQRLIDEDCIPFLEVSTVGTPYSTRFFYSTGSYNYSNYVNGLSSSMNLSEFLQDEVSPNPGQIYLYWLYIAPTNPSSETIGGGGGAQATAPPVSPTGQSIAKTGVTYVKVNRVDISGSNNTLSLQGLKQFRIKFSDTIETGGLIPSASIVQYNVLSISEFQDYYLYLIDPKDVTSLSDNNIGSYSVNATTTTGSIVPLDGAAFVNFTYSSSVSGVGTSYFNSSSTNFYTFGDTPNIGFDVTASVTLTGSNVAISLNLYDNNGNIIHNIISPYSYTTSLRTITVSGSFSSLFSNAYTSSIIEGMYFNLSIDNPGGAKPYYSASFILNQWVAPSSSSPSSTVLSPYITKLFTNTDCDSTMNNALNNKVSSIYQVADYSSGYALGISRGAGTVASTGPVNFQAIVSRSADYAQLNDYNYYSTANQLSKYIGDKLVTQRINFISIGDIIQGNIPNVQLLDNYFIYFDWIGGTTPELIGKTAVHIKALIDINAVSSENESGIYEPSDVGIYFDTFLRTFFKNDFVNIYVRAANNSVPSLGLKKIIGPAQFPIPIIASQITGSVQNQNVGSIQSTMSFGGYSDTNENWVTYWDSTIIPSYDSLFTSSLYMNDIGINNPNVIYYWDEVAGPNPSSKQSAVNSSTFKRLRLSGSLRASNTKLLNPGTSGNSIRITTPNKYTKIKITANFNDIILFNESLNNTPSTADTNYGPNDTSTISLKNKYPFVPLTAQLIQRSIISGNEAVLGSVTININTNDQNYFPTRFNTSTDTNYWQNALKTQNRYKLFGAELLLNSETVNNYEYYVRCILAPNPKPEQITNTFSIKYSNEEILNGDAGDDEKTKLLLAIGGITLTGGFSILYYNNNVRPEKTVSTTTTLPDSKDAYWKAYISSFEIQIENVTPSTVGLKPTASYVAGNSNFQYFITGSLSGPSFPPGFNDKNPRIISAPQFKQHIYKSSDSIALIQGTYPHLSPGQPGYLENGHLETGYAKFDKFQVYPGDEIRFECDENQVYKILEVYRPGVGYSVGSGGGTVYWNQNELKLVLDRPVAITSTSSVELQNGTYMVTSWINPTGSFVLVGDNGPITIAVTGSPAPSNGVDVIYVPTGSTTGSTFNNVIAHVNYSCSLFGTTYSSSFSVGISASVSSSVLRFHSKLTGSIGNGYDYYYFPNNDPSAINAGNFDGKIVESFSGGSDDYTELNSFLIRRNAINPSFVILDWDGNGYKGGDGFLVPQFLKSNGPESSVLLNKAIAILRKKGLIS